MTKSMAAMERITGLMLFLEAMRWGHFRYRDVFQIQGDFVKTGGGGEICGACATTFALLGKNESRTRAEIAGGEIDNEFSEGMFPVLEINLSEFAAYDEEMEETYGSFGKYIFALNDAGEIMSRIEAEIKHAIDSELKQSRSDLSQVRYVKFGKAFASHIFAKLQKVAPEYVEWVNNRKVDRTPSESLADRILRRQAEKLVKRTDAEKTPAAVKDITQ